MPIYSINFLDARELSAALDKLGADARSLPFFDNRREVKALYVTDVDWRGANVLKQEMLSRGGDAAVHARAVDHGVERSDFILFGTKKQLGFLAEKIESMQWWGFPAIAADIRAALYGLAQRAQPAGLPSGATLPFGERTLIMGIINLTDDSFFAGSRAGADLELTLKMAAGQINAGADIIDLGAESTRPGAPRAEAAEEVRRLAAAVKALRREFPKTPLSIDTTRRSAAEAALAEGADIINDISGLTFEEGIATSAAAHGAMLVLMHMRGTPETMTSLCGYNNLLHDVAAFFEEGIAKAERLGLKKERIILDPGIGFAKNYEQNMLLLRHPEALRAFGLPLLVGVSRKGCVGIATDSSAAVGRLEGTMAVSALCAWQGVEIVRVHDVGENKKAVMMIDAIKRAKYE